MRQTPAISGQGRRWKAMGRRDQTAGCVIPITVIAMRVCYSTIMASIHSYEGWWDLSLIDDRNERALFSAFVAVVAVWATIFLFALF